MVGKQRMILLVSLLFGLPALVTLVLLTSSTKLELVDGPQPGGIVQGRVARPGGSAGIDVDVVAAQVTGNLIGDEVARARTDTAGAFAIELPPLEGRYVLRFTGQALQEALVEYGWIGRGGVSTQPPPVSVEMQTGCRLEVEIVGTNKQPAGAGNYELTAATNAGLLGGFAQGRVARSGVIEKGTFSVDGLPAMNVRLLVRLDSGERVNSVLDLAEGVNRHKIEL